MVARFVRDEEVAGSNPVAPTIGKRRKHCEPKASRARSEAEPSRSLSAASESVALGRSRFRSVLGDQCQIGPPVLPALGRFGLCVGGGGDGLQRHRNAP